nr:hypothetical protein T03D3.8 - Caenorhabditis elegans [Caenorhabditis elegans]
MFDDWICLYLSSTFCALAFLVNPIFIHLIVSEKSAVFGNYRYLLLCFAVFNMIYSMMNVLVPLEIHNYRYSSVVFVRYGWFQTSSSEFNYHMLTARCSFIGSSYAVLLSHFIYRYLVILDSSLTRHHFPHDWIVFIVFGLLFFVVGSDKTTLRAWELITSLSTISIVSITSFFVMARLIMQKLKTMSVRTSQKTSRLQFELLRALIVQTVIPIFISFSPCLLCWYSPIFGIQLNKSFNYFESIALGVFSFVDPIAIIFCLPIFRRRILNAINCFSKTCNENSTIFITL